MLERAAAPRSHPRGLGRAAQRRPGSSRGRLLCVRADAWPRCAILGGGVMGLTTALQLLEQRGDITIDLYTDREVSATTSYGSGGLWMPYQIVGTPEDVVNRWGRTSFEHLARLHHSADAGPSGVQLVTKFGLYSSEVPERPSWQDIVYRFQDITAAQLASMGSLKAFQGGFACETFVADPTVYLPWLHGRIDALGGVKRVTGKVASLTELPEGYAAIFNCTGLGSLQLLGDDALLPIRGQVLRVRAPWIKHSWTFDGTHYVIPNVNSVVVGGTQQRGNFSEAVDAVDSASIFETCARYIPSLRGAEVLYEWAGLRPGRSSGVRLEREIVQLHGVDVPVIHNYGHGGSGITLHWGCVQDAIALAALN